MVRSSKTIRTRGAAFTLIEMMVVVAIIVLLASITVMVGIKVKSNAAYHNTRITLKSLDGLYSMYIADGLQAPTTANAYNDSWSWVSAFMNYAPTRKTMMPIVSPDPYSTNWNVNDGWGNAIYYQQLGGPNNQAPGQRACFQSAGPDAKYNCIKSGNVVVSGDDLYSYDP